MDESRRSYDDYVHHASIEISENVGSDDSISIRIGKSGLVFDVFALVAKQNICNRTTQPVEDSSGDAQHDTTSFAGDDACCTGLIRPQTIK